MIDRTMNFFWEGSKLSWMRFMTIKSFCYYNPDWKVVLWQAKGYKESNNKWSSREKQDFFAYTGPDYISEVAILPVDRREVRIDDITEADYMSFTPVHQSDLFRWWLLRTQSGWYADMDILWTAPMVDCEKEIAICQTRGHMAIGLLGSGGNNKFYRDVFQLALVRVRNGDYQSAGTKTIHELLTGIKNQLLIANVFHLIRLRYGEVVEDLPEKTVYPWYYKEMAQVFTHVSEIPPNTVGIHWYGGTDLAQEYNALLRGPISSVHSTFMRYARKIYHD